MIHKSNCDLPVVKWTWKVSEHNVTIQNANQNELYIRELTIGRNLELNLLAHGEGVAYQWRAFRVKDFCFGRGLIIGMLRYLIYQKATLQLRDADENGQHSTQSEWDWRQSHSLSLVIVVCFPLPVSLVPGFSRLKSKLNQFERPRVKVETVEFTRKRCYILSLKQWD